MRPRTTQRSQRLRPAWLLAVASIAVAAVGLTIEECVDAALLPGTGEPGFVDPDDWASRQLDYLEFATQSIGNSINNATNHMERDLRDPGYTAPTPGIPATAWDGAFRDMGTLEDTRDFDMVYLLNAYLGYGPGSAAGGDDGHPYVPAELWEKARQAILSFKYWFTAPDYPTPPMPHPDIPERTWDESFYWTENHQILYFAAEYLAGQRFPDECFWITGFGSAADPLAPRTDALDFGAPVDPEACDRADRGEMRGRRHMELAEPRIFEWLDERIRFGFTEWLSNVYYQKDVVPLVTLIEFAENDEIVEKATIVLDLIMMEMATQTMQGVLGTTHGRSEMKDKYRGPREDTWGLVKLAFQQQDEFDYRSGSDPGPTLLARAKKYRLPAVIDQAARSAAPVVTRMQVGIPLDTFAPANEPYEPPPGLSFETVPDVSREEADKNFTIWWGTGCWTAWQVVELTLEGATFYNLWDTQLLGPFSVLRDFVGDPPNIPFAISIADTYADSVAVGCQHDVNIYTYRTGDYMLSSAQNYRKGANGAEYHAWQATFDADALVFTTHPMVPAQPPSEFIDKTDGEPGYWTGTASMPLSGQYENVAVHMYSPRYPTGGVIPNLLPLFDYVEETHAFFPQDAFDQVDQDCTLDTDLAECHWTFGRHENGYIALFSWRPVEWRSVSASELEKLSDDYAEPPSSVSGGLVFSEPYDLVADDGVENVWIVEMGRAEDWASFEAFRDAVLAADVSVTPRPTPERSQSAGFQVFHVVYQSPSQGEVTLDWDETFTVDGETIPLEGFPRMESPWTTLQLDQRAGAVFDDAYGFHFDFDAPSRLVWGPETD